MDRYGYGYGTPDRMMDPVSQRTSRRYGTDDRQANTAVPNAQDKSDGRRFDDGQINFKYNTNQMLQINNTASKYGIYNRLRLRHKSNTITVAVYSLRLRACAQFARARRYGDISVRITGYADGRITLPDIAVRISDNVTHTVYRPYGTDLRRSVATDSRYAAYAIKWSIRAQHQHQPGRK